MADAIYICILRFWKSDNWYLPETWQVICQNTRQEQVQQVGKRILQPASRTGHGICQTFEPIPEVFGRMSVSFP